MYTCSIGLRAGDELHGLEGVLGLEGPREAAGLVEHLAACGRYG
jgi:hypothetical protein